MILIQIRLSARRCSALLHAPGPSQGYGSSDVVEQAVEEAGTDATALSRLLRSSESWFQPPADDGFIYALEVVLLYHDKG